MSDHCNKKMAKVSWWWWSVDGGGQAGALLTNLWKALDCTDHELFIARLRKKCPYSKLFWSAFSRIQTEYGEIRSVSPYSARMREITDQDISEYGHFSHSVMHKALTNVFCISFIRWRSKSKERRQITLFFMRFT